MKTKFLYIAALALIVGLSGCRKDEPYDTQSPDDTPRILIPYETASGLISFSCDNPDTPLYDSVIVTPSRYTTVNWYVDGLLVWTGVKINMRFPQGTYDVLIEAVTDAGKSTKRNGILTVKAGEADPYSAAPSVGRHVPAAHAIELEGKNLNKVAKVILATDLYAEHEVCAIEPSSKSGTKLVFALPDIADGTYYLRFLDTESNVFGSDNIEVHHGAVVTGGYDAFIPGDKNWEIDGINLDKVSAIIIDDVVITEFTATETKIKLTAPDMPKNSKHILSMQDASGAKVLFATGYGTVTEVETLCSDQTPLWNGPVALDWNSDLIQIPATNLKSLHAGDSLFVYFDHPAAEYYEMRVTVPDWSVDYFPQRSMGEALSPYVLIFDENCETLAKTNKTMCFVGFGLIINKVTYKNVE